MISFLAIVFTFSVVIFVHELGHFLLAVKSGVIVEVFSLGFGPELFGFTKNGIRFRLSAVPLGGYVKMKGETIEDDDAYEPGSFTALPPLKRIPILVSGAGMNFLTGIVIIFFLFYSTGFFLMENIPVVGGLLEGYPAIEEGFKEDDIILSIGGVEVSTWEDVSREIAARGGVETEFVLERSGKGIVIITEPKYQESADRGFMGISPPGEMVRPGVARAFWESIMFTYELCKGLLIFLGRMIIGTAPPDVSGPIGIAQAVSQAASRGLVDVFQLIAIISIQLGFINLFPIPILDGGHIILSFLEKIKGSKLDSKKVMVANMVGVTLLLLLVFFASWQDIRRLFQ